MTVLALILPCYNESEIISQSISTANNYLKKLKEKKIISENSFLLIVDDGSTDNTWEIICKLPEKPRAIKLNKNFGHQIAIYAGIEESFNHCDISITMDIDLEQNIEAIEKFIQKYNSGFDIVVGIRDQRKNDSFLKEKLSKLFYKILSIDNKKNLEGQADFRLLSKEAMKKILNKKLDKIFFRDLIYQLDLKISYVKHSINILKYRKSKYTFTKMLKLAYSAIIDYSNFPLKFIFFLNFFVIFLALIVVAIYLYQTLILKNTIPGWASIILSLYLLSSIQIFSIGIISIYLKKILNLISDNKKYTIEKKIEINE
jgi:glycosyltransferase involved in cell wall biosynthesis